jgi:hypothetical protein
LPRSAPVFSVLDGVARVCNLRPECVLARADLYRAREPPNPTRNQTVGQFNANAFVTRVSSAGLQPRTQRED